MKFYPGKWGSNSSRLYKDSPAEPITLGEYLYMQRSQESSILFRCGKNPQLQDAYPVERVVVRLPSVAVELRAFGSSLQILERAGQLTAPPSRIYSKSTKVHQSETGIAPS